MILTITNRWHAFGIHLLLSAMLFIVLASIIYFFWYPGILFRYDGGLEGMKLIASVDFIIGPVLTLLVFKHGKPSLKFDLSCIALLQALCLVGGMWTVFQTRPVAVVYAAGEFRSIPYQVFRDYDINPADIEILRQRWPVWISVLLTPEEEKNAHHASFKRILLDHRIFFKTNQYRPLHEGFPTADKAYDSLAVAKDPSVAAGALTGIPDSDNARFFPAAFGTGAGYLVFGANQQQPIGFVSSMGREKTLWQRLTQFKVMLMQFTNSLIQRNKTPIID